MDWGPQSLGSDSISPNPPARHLKLTRRVQIGPISPRTRWVGDRNLVHMRNPRTQDLKLDPFEFVQEHSHKLNKLARKCAYILASCAS